MRSTVMEYFTIVPGFCQVVFKFVEDHHTFYYTWVNHSACIGRDHWILHRTDKSFEPCCESKPAEGAVLYFKIPKTEKHHLIESLRNHLLMEGEAKRLILVDG